MGPKPTTPRESSLAIAPVTSPEGSHTLPLSIPYLFPGLRPLKTERAGMELTRNSGRSRPAFAISVVVIVNSVGSGFSY